MRHKGLLSVLSAILFYCLQTATSWAGFPPPMLPSGTFTSGDCLQSNGGLLVKDAGAPCGGVTPSIGGAITSGTAGSILFVNPIATFAQDNAQFFWDDIDHWLGIGTAVPTHAITFASTATGISANNQSDQVTNYERNVQQWQSNAFTIGNYIGGSGTIRQLKLGLQPTAGTTTLSTGRVFTISSVTAIAPGIFDFTPTSTGGAGTVTTMSGTYTGANVTQNAFSIQPTINQTGTSSYSTLLIQPYELSTGSGTHYLINAGTNSAAAGGGTFTSKFSVDDAGNGIMHSLAFNPTTSGITGTATNDNASTGTVGEYQTATGTGVALTTVTPANCTSLSLTAGDWDVSAVEYVAMTGGATPVYNEAAISTTSATLPSQPALGSFILPGSVTPNPAIPTGTVRESLSTTTTVYAVVQSSFPSGSVTATCAMQARRAR